MKNIAGINKESILKWLPWGLLALVYSPVLNELYRGRWEDIDYTHAYFILPVSIWLAWRKRKQIKEISSAEAVSRGGIVIWADIWMIPLILGSFLLLLGWRNDYLMLSSISLILFLSGMIGYLYGWQVVKLLKFPLLYLFLMVPPPIGVLDSITLPMRNWISILTEGILKGLHYPIVRDGLLLSIGGHEIYMGAPCSGFRSLITMIALGLVYAYVIKGPFKKKALLVVSVIPLALLGNLARVVSMCLVTFYFGDGIGHTYHDYSGYVIFLVLIAGLVGIEVWLNKIMKK